MGIRIHMKAICCLTLAAGITLCLPAWGTRRDGTAPNAAQESKPKISPEMERLKFYLGEWDYTETYPKSAAFPNGRQNTGVYTSKPGPGGNSLINTFHSQGPAGDFEGLIVMTWDPREKSYKSYTFGNDSPGGIVQTGKFEDAALVFRLEFTAGGASIKTRNTTRLLEPTKLISEQFITRNDGPETMIVHVEAKKR